MGGWDQGRMRRLGNSEQPLRDGEGTLTILPRPLRKPVSLLSPSFFEKGVPLWADLWASLPSWFTSLRFPPGGSLQKGMLASVVDHLLASPASLDIQSLDLRPVLKFQPGRIGLHIIWFPCRTPPTLQPIGAFRGPPQANLIWPSYSTSSGGSCLDGYPIIPHMPLCRPFYGQVKVLFLF